MDTCYLEFTGGFDDDGQPQPLRQIGIPVQIARQADNGDVVDDYVPVTINPSGKESDEIPGRIVPGTRVVATRAAGVMEHLLSRGDFVLADPPGKKSTATRARKSAPRKRAKKPTPPPADTPATETTDQPQGEE